MNEMTFFVICILIITTTINVQLRKTTTKINELIKNRDSNNIHYIETHYFLSDNDRNVTEDDDIEWIDTIDEIKKGYFLWTRTTFVFLNGEKHYSYSVSCIGKDGKDGTDGLHGRDGRDVFMGTYRPTFYQPLKLNHSILDTEKIK